MSSTERSASLDRRGTDLAWRAAWLILALLALLLASHLYRGSAGSHANLERSEALFARRQELFMELQGLLEAEMSTLPAAPSGAVVMAADMWFRAEVADSPTWAVELAEPSHRFAECLLFQGGSSTSPGSPAAECEFELTITSPDPGAPKGAGRRVLFAGVVMTLTLEESGQVDLRITLEREAAPGGWSEKLGDRILSSMKGVVDVDKRGVRVDVGYRLP